LVRHRVIAVLGGVALAAPGAWIEFSGHIEAWWAQGLALVLGATGVALIWAGLLGNRPDWIDSD
jgi:hypothetical protein